MKKTTIIICCLALCILILSGVLLADFLMANRTIKYVDDYMVLALCTNHGDKAYYFSLTEEGILKCSLISRGGFSRSIFDPEGRWAEVDEQHYVKDVYLAEVEKELDKQDMQILSNLADKLYESDFIEGRLSYYPSLELQFGYRGYIFKMAHGSQASETLGEIADKFIELSPLEIDFNILRIY